MRSQEIKGGDREREGCRSAMENPALTPAGEVVLLFLQSLWPELQQTVFHSLLSARSLSLKEEIGWLRNCFSEKSQHPPVRSTWKNFA